MNGSTPEYLRDLAANIRKSPLTLANLSLRDELVEGPELLALMATRGMLGYRETLATVRDLLSGRLSQGAAVDLFDPASLSALARLMAGRPATGPDYREAAEIAQAVRRIRRNTQLPFDADRIEAQVNLAVGNFDYVEKHLPDFLIDDITRWMIKTELLNPTWGRPGSLFEPWFESFNEVFRDQGLLPLSLVPGDGALFDRVTVAVPEAMIRNNPGDPLVTIIMSTFKPDQSLLTAVGSLVNQTWSNLEVLLVDDCSPPEFDGLLQSAAALDPRVKLIRMEHNGGTYKIRNHAISVAGGEFIAFQDSDDWAHPERLERQLIPLLESEELVATMCTTVRVQADLRVNSVGLSPLRKCASSPIFRRRLVMDALGAFDEVRKGADTEFSRRLELVFGEEAVFEVNATLVLTQLTTGSLSRSEFGFSWHHGARVAYRESYHYWHRLIADGRASPRLDPAAGRVWVAPDRFLRTGPAAPQTCDVLFMSDWGQGIERHVGAAREVRALSDSGLSTTVAQIKSIRFAHPGRPPQVDEIHELQAIGKTRFAMWDEDLHARLIVIRDPELLNFTRPADDVRFRTDRLVVVADHPCRTPGGWLTYDPAYVEDHAQRMFGVAVEWLPGTPDIAQSLKNEGANCAILPAQKFATVSLHKRPYIGLRGGPRPVVGTTGFVAPLKDRPAIETLHQLLPDDDAYDVRIRADRPLLRRISKHERLPANWLVLGEDEPSSFFSQLDVFVGIPMRSWGPELSWAAVEALAHGVVAILDPGYEGQFGNAALYARPDEVADVLAELAGDPERFSSQQFRGYEFCRTQLSARTLVDVVRSLGDFADDERRVLS